MNRGPSKIPSRIDIWLWGGARWIEKVSLHGGIQGRIQMQPQRQAGSGDASLASC